mmetsp:Transcript_16749/g.36392  ORF Transcript_16749/g.36392 Transcript_16749/m.36392 type:complete len:159 (+) Transcript_16749:223-699(+)
MRWFHYKPYSKTENDEFIGSSPHTDWGFLTLILPSSTSYSGLEVNCDGTWVQVPKKEGCLVANCGDFLSLSVSGTLKSPLHRVVLPEQGEDRFSSVFFMYPRFDAKLDVASDQRQDYSLFYDQTNANTTEFGQSIAPVSDQINSFGSFIAKKWDEVGR